MNSMFLTPMLEQGELPVIRRNIGSKLIKMDSQGEAKAGRSVKIRRCTSPNCAIVTL